jgi:hypothetical protein
MAFSNRPISMMSFFDIDWTYPSWPMTNGDPIQGMINIQFVDFAREGDVESLGIIAKKFQQYELPIEAAVMECVRHDDVQTLTCVLEIDLHRNGKFDLLRSPWDLLKICVIHDSVKLFEFLFNTCYEYYKDYIQFIKRVAYCLNRMKILMFLHKESPVYHPSQVRRALDCEENLYFVMFGGVVFAKYD